jgi:hypothetical protein
MAQLDDLPDPPGPSDPFDQPGAAYGGGGYLGGSDDEEIRKIRRRVSPFGKVMILVVLGVLAGVGYFLVKSASDQSAAESAKTAGLAELGHVMDQTLPPDQLASRVRDVYNRYKASVEVRMAARRVLAGLHDTTAVPLLIEGLRGDAAERRQAALGLAEIGSPDANSARDALAAVLPQTGEVDRTEVAWAMVVLDDPRSASSKR